MEWDLPPKALALVKEWSEEHEEALLKIWNTQEFVKLPPLEQGVQIMFHKIKKIQPLSDYKLLVNFASGEQKKYNVESLFDKWESFRAFIFTTGLFEQVQLDSGGYGVSWNDELDLSCNELYNNGKDV